MLARWFERMSNMAIWAAINTEFKKQLGIRAKSAGNEQLAREIEGTDFQPREKSSMALIYERNFTYS